MLLLALLALAPLARSTSDRILQEESEIIDWERQVAMPSPQPPAPPPQPPHPPMAPGEAGLCQCVVTKKHLGSTDGLAAFIRGAPCNCMAGSTELHLQLADERVQLDSSLPFLSFTLPQSITALRISGGGSSGRRTQLVCAGAEDDFAVRIAAPASANTRISISGLDLTGCSNGGLGILLQGGSSQGMAAVELADCSFNNIVSSTSSELGAGVGSLGVASSASLCHISSFSVSFTYPDVLLVAPSHC